MSLIYLPDRVAVCVWRGGWVAVWEWGVRHSMSLT